MFVRPFISLALAAGLALAALPATAAPQAAPALFAAPSIHLVGGKHERGGRWHKDAGRHLWHGWDDDREDDWDDDRRGRRQAGTGHGWGHQQERGYWPGRSRPGRGAGVLRGHRGAHRSDYAESRERARWLERELARERARLDHLRRNRDFDHWDDRAARAINPYWNGGQRGMSPNR